MFEVACCQSNFTHTLGTRSKKKKPRTPPSPQLCKVVCSTLNTHRTIFTLNGWLVVTQVLSLVFKVIQTFSHLVSWQVWHVSKNTKRSKDLLLKKGERAGYRYCWTSIRQNKTFNSPNDRAILTPFF